MGFSEEFRQNVVHWRRKEGWVLTIDALEFQCWRRLLRVPWTAWRWNESLLKEINPEYSLEGLILKLQYFGHSMWRAESLEKTLMLGKTESKMRKGGRGWDGSIALLTQWTLSRLLNRGQRNLAGYSPWGRKESDITERLSLTNICWGGAFSAYYVAILICFLKRILSTDDLSHLGRVLKDRTNEAHQYIHKEISKEIPGAGEDSWESLGQRGDQTSGSSRKSTLNTHWKDWCWSFSILVIWCGWTTHWKCPWCWERLMAEGDESIRGWGDCMASLMQWTWTWANFGRWWGTERPGVLQSMGSQGVGHDWVTEQQGFVWVYQKEWFIHSAHTYSVYSSTQ